MKFKRKYFFGGDRKDSEMDYITEYIREDYKVKIIIVQHSFSSWSEVLYNVEKDGKCLNTFNTLKEAKFFAEKL